MTKTKTIMTVVNMPIDKVMPYERNPRINDGAVEAVIKSIKEFGWRSPIVVDKNNIVIAGHTRLKAAKAMELVTVPVHIADNLTPEQVQAYRIADNATGDIAEWDYNILPFEIRELEDAEFDLTTLGFSASELAKIMTADEEDIVADGETDPDTIPETSEKQTSQHGDIYQLGDHLLLCGEDSDAGDIAQLIGSKNVALWLTGYPRLDDFVSDGMPQDVVSDMFQDGISIIAKHLRPGASFYVFHHDSGSYEFQHALNQTGLSVAQCLIWNKNITYVDKLPYNSKHEHCFYGYTNEAPPKWHAEGYQSSVLDFSVVDGQPDAKPVEMLVRLIKNSTTRGDIVTDNQGGSGSTLIACEQTGRQCRMVESDPKKCDTIRQRWAEFVHGVDCDWIKKTPLTKEG